MNNLMAKNQISTGEPLRLIRIRDVMSQTGLSRPTIYRAMASGHFPQCVKFGSASLWPVTDINTWIQARIGESKRANIRHEDAA